jgi:predicted permease
MSAPQRRRAAWSEALTGPIARSIPAEWRPATLGAIKAIHTVLFASIAAAIAWFVLDGLRQRPSRKGAVALAVAVGETAVYLSNNQVCPLTPLAEEVGAERGSVVDIFLPDWAARRIPVVAASALIVGIMLNVAALARREPLRSWPRTLPLWRT